MKDRNNSYQRFENLLRSRGTTVYRVSKETGISASTFTDWKNGRSVPKADKMRLIADFFEVSLDSLLGSAAGEVSEFAGYTSVKAKKMVPIIGEIRAGSPIITNETLLGREFADVDDAEEYFFLKVCGDSMKNIGMVNGSLVLFRKQQYAEEGDIVACLVGGESATVKRFHRAGKSIALIPENESYSPIRLTTDDFEAGEARILGVAVEIKIKL
ncbi:MAG: helix-turn-helix domain-containing protein [Clostridia bacterium]|nr:helix-turn-helix domain-containing protein [Clostridia bacterium]